MKTKLFILFSIVLLVTSCATNHPMPIVPTEEAYGFWGGFWHGITLFFSCIGAMFSSDIVVYSSNNTGNMYDVGFFMGAYGLSIIINMLTTKS